MSRSDASVSNLFISTSYDASRIWLEDGVRAVVVEGDAALAYAEGVGKRHSHHGDGDTVAVEVWRNGQIISVEITL